MHWNWCGCDVAKLIDTPECEILSRVNGVIKTYIGVFCFVGVFFAGVYLAPLFKTRLQSPAPIL
jgi:hypothetical protein